MQARGISEAVILPAFVNMSAILAARFGGEPLLREAIVIMAERHKYLREGRFPKGDWCQPRPTARERECKSCLRTMLTELDERGVCIGCQELELMTARRPN